MFLTGMQTHFHTRTAMRGRSYAMVFNSSREADGNTLSSVWIKRTSWLSSYYLYQMKTTKEAQCWCWNVPPNCFPALWTANWTPFHCTMMIPSVLPGGKFIWKSTSSTLNYLPAEFEQRDEVEFRHSFHLTRSGSCFSRRRLDISVPSSSRPRKHSPGTEAVKSFELCCHKEADFR